MTLRAAALLAFALVLAACQSAPPPEAPGATTIGNWTVKTSGSVEAEVGAVR